MSKRIPWVFRLPKGLREQPAWVFIGTLVCLAGMSYSLGFSESTSVAQVLDEMWLRVWGAFLALAGFLVVFSTISANRPLEKMALRFQSIALLMYMCWLLSAVPISRATVTVVLCIALAGLSEIRIAVITALLRPLPAALKGWDIQ